MELSYLSILVASLASMGVGFLWYSPLLFGTQWIAAQGMTKKEFEAQTHAVDMRLVLSSSFVVTLLQASVLAVAFELLKLDTALQAGVISALAWLGFAAPVQLNKVLFGKDSLKLWVLETTHQLAQLLTMSLVLWATAAW